jgi:hypothetical protein
VGTVFASQELKVLLAHLVMKYDFTFVENDAVPKAFEMEGAELTNAEKVVRARRRREEVDLDVCDEGYGEV